MTFDSAPFGSIYLEPVRNGLTRPTSVRGEGYRMVNMGEIFAYDRISDLEMERVQLNERELQTALLEPGDLLFARSSLTPEGTGKCSLIQNLSEETTFESHLIRARLDRTKADPRFYFYYFQSYYGRANVLSIAKQVGAAGLPGSKLAGLSVPRPILSTQSRIADILSTYDDLIENNQRRMAILEDAARQLYREWFVRLRFPGYEHTLVNRGVPMGWQRKTLAELCTSVDYGYTASAQQEDVGPKFLRITDIVPEFIDWSLVPHCAIEEKRLFRFRLTVGDIVVARTGATVGYAKRIPKRHPEAVFASYLVRLRPAPQVSGLMIGTFVESDSYKGYIRSRIGGAAQPNANARVLAGAEILVPPKGIQHAFDDFVEPMVDQRELLQLQNGQLRAARDLLLPRLMSGEITMQ